MQRTGVIWATTVGLLVFAPTQQVVAQPLTVATFSDAYQKVEEVLYRKYVFDRRVKYHTSTNHSADPNSKLGSVSIYEAVVGRNASRDHNRTAPALRNPKVVTGSLQLESEAYVLQAGDRPDNYKIGAHRPGRGPGRYGYAFGAAGPCLFPVTYMSSSADTTTGTALEYANSKQPTGLQFKLLGVRTTEWRGRPAVEAKFEQSYGLINLLVS